MSRVILWMWCFNVPSQLLTGLYQVLSSIPRGCGARKNRGGMHIWWWSIWQACQGPWWIPSKLFFWYQVWGLSYSYLKVGCGSFGWEFYLRGVKYLFPSPISLAILKGKWPTLSLELILQVLLTQVISQTLGMLTYNVSEVFVFLFVLVCFLVAAQRNFEMSMLFLMFMKHFCTVNVLCHENTSD